MLKKLKNITFPIVRRIFPSLIAQEIVSVQPMTAPSGILTWLDFQFKRDVVRSQEELNKLFRICWKFEERFPPGSVVHFKKIHSSPFVMGDPLEFIKLTVSSEAYVLSNISSVGFFVMEDFSENKNDGKYVYVDQLMEYNDILKELEIEDEEFKRNETT
jgi:hypothetical protein